MPENIPDHWPAVMIFLTTVGQLEGALYSKAITSYSVKKKLSNSSVQLKGPKHRPEHFNTHQQMRLQKV